MHFFRNSQAQIEADEVCSVCSQLATILAFVIGALRRRFDCQFIARNCRTKEFQYKHQFRAQQRNRRYNSAAAAYEADDSDDSDCENDKAEKKKLVAL